MIEICDSDFGEFDAFNAAHPMGSLFQSAAWARVKGAWTRRVVLVRRGGVICGGVSVLCRSIPGTPFRLLYAPRGPVCFPDEVSVLEELTEGLRRLGREQRAAVVLTDPAVPSSDARFRQNMLQLGWGLRPEAEGFETIHAQHVALLALSGRTEAELLAGMKQKTRYNVRLAQRRGVTVRRFGREGLGMFCRLMRETAQRDGFVARPRAYYAAVLESLGEQAQLFLAFVGDEPVAGAIAAHDGRTAWYLYGALGNRHRECMASYLVQWEMLCWARGHGCAWYDFRGVPRENAGPLAGLRRFKCGFGAEVVTYIGELRLVISPVGYAWTRLWLPLLRRAGLLLARLRR